MSLLIEQIKSYTKRITIILVAIIVLMAGNLLIYQFSDFDFSQMIFLFFFWYPFTALALGLVSFLLKQRPGIMIFNCLLVFLTVLMLWYNDSALIYLPFYLTVSLVGYGFGFVFQFLSARHPNRPPTRPQIIE